MNSDPITISPEATVAEARAVMRAQGIRHLPVVSAGHLIGIISDRDVSIDDATLNRVRSLERLGEVTGESRPVEAVMSTSVHTVPVSATMAEAARMMLSRRVSALPLVEDDGRLIGIVTTTDCLLVSLTATDDLVGGLAQGAGEVDA
ncbi:CBS domain-containing protein [Euzebya tangerina]|uniref:CBS domain-containing protein n=1 Tax=Euzebya tangerina TaxID=591198 RepID=UPI000E31E799|nr:CBS domain-containing protein [Euzebya tangerina]